MTEAPVLAMPMDEGLFILDTDASAESIGAVLSQSQNGNENVICYGSRVCSTAEKNYDVTRREMLAVVYFMKAFRQYLLGRKFLLRTDHSALQWLRRTPTPIGQQARWLSVVEEFDFEIQHRPGSRHVNADALSRRPHRVDAIRQTAASPAASTTLPLDWDLATIAAEQQADPDLQWVVERKQSSDSPPDPDEMRPQSGVVKSLVSQWPQLRLLNGLLVREWLKADGTGKQWLQLVPPPPRRNELIRLAHEGMAGGHLGIRRTMKQLQKRAYWPGWTESVRIFLKRCTACARYLRGRPPHQGLLQEMSVGEPFERIAIDLTGPHPPSAKGNKHILTVIDYFTRWAEAFAIRTPDALTVARVLVEQVFTRYGCPRQLLSDQGGCFEAELFQHLCQLLGVDKLRTTAYRPSANGRIERLHRTLNAMLGKLVSTSQRDWDRHLPFVLSAYRSTEHEGTGFTPCRLFLGREVVLPIDLVLSDCKLHNPDVLSHADYVEQTDNRMRLSFQLVREFTHRLVVSRAARYNLRVRSAQYPPGTWVWFHYPRRRPGTKEKWASFYTGPYRVMEQVGPVLFRIQKSKRAAPKLVYIDKLKKFEGEPPTDWETGDSLEPRSTEENFEALLFDGGDQENIPLSRPRREIRRPKRFTEDL